MGTNAEQTIKELKEKIAADEALLTKAELALEMYTKQAQERYQCNTAEELSVYIENTKKQIAEEEALIEAKVNEIKALLGEK